MDVEARIQYELATQPYPLLFATINGAHLYGFPSPDSDYDLRGIHILPAREIVGLYDLCETIEITRTRDGLTFDLVTHDAGKFFGLLLNKNGHVLEQLYSPLLLRTTPAHDELKQIAKQCFTRQLGEHYRGFAAKQWKLWLKHTPPRVKPLLYVFRILLTGIHLMRTGEIEANLVNLNQTFKLPYVNDLVARKLAGAAQSTLENANIGFFTSEYARLNAQLKDAAQTTHLPATMTAKAALHDLLVRLRLATLD